MVSSHNKAVKMSTYEDPVKNYKRVKDTYEYLCLYTSGRLGEPLAAWYKEHIEHIKVYLNVLENTEERDQRPAELMRDMIREFSQSRRFNLEYYLLVCDKLIEIVGDMHLEEAVAEMGM